MKFELCLCAIAGEIPACERGAGLDLKIFQGTMKQAFSKISKWT